MALDELRRLLADLSDTEVAFLVADRPLTARLLRQLVGRYVGQELPRLAAGEGEGAGEGVVVVAVVVVR